jgi:hypothetical protein
MRSRSDFGADNSLDAAVKDMALEALAGVLYTAATKQTRPALQQHF